MCIHTLMRSAAKWAYIHKHRNFHTLRWLCCSLITSHSKGSSVTANSAALIIFHGPAEMQSGSLCLLLKYSQHQHGESKHRPSFARVCPSRRTLILESRCNTNCKIYLLNRYVSYFVGSKAWSCLKKKNIECKPPNQHKNNNFTFQQK